MLKSLFRQIRFRAIQWHCSKRPLSMDFQRGLCILAPHPDDETMGCGQLISLASRLCVPCRVFIISDGSGSHRNCCNTPETDIAAGRQASCRKAMEALGLPKDSLTFFAFPDGELSRHKKEIHNRLLEELDGQKHDIVVPHELEGWSDHQAVHHVGRSIATAFQCRLLSYCIWFYYSMPFRKFSQVHWNSSLILHDLDALEKKRAALEIYRNDIASCGKPYTGVLPDLLWKAVNDEQEVYFEE